MSSSFSSWSKRLHLRLIGWPAEDGQLEWWIEGKPKRRINLSQTEFIILAALAWAAIRANDEYVSKVSARKLARTLYLWNAAADPVNVNNIFPLIYKVRGRLNGEEFSNVPALPEELGKWLIVRGYRIDHPREMLEVVLINPDDPDEEQDNNLIFDGPKAPLKM